MIEGDVLMFLIGHSFQLVEQPGNHLVPQQGLLDDIVAVLHLYVGIEDTIGFDLAQGTHLAEAVAAALLKAHGLHIAAIAAVMTVTVMLMIEFDLTVQSLFVYKLLEPGVNIQ